jgi:hypothetical protein
MNTGGLVIVSLLNTWSGRATGVKLRTQFLSCLMMRNMA